MTDLNNEREAFQRFLKTKGVVKVGWNSLGVLTNLVREAGCTLSYNDIELMQEVWMEKAKAQAVPETHLLIPKDKVRDLVAELEMAFEDNLHLTISDLLPLQQDLKVILETSESGAEG